MYGELRTLKATALTRFTVVRLEISDDIATRVSQGSVVTLTISDPTQGVAVVTLTLGSRMPTSYR